ncbi:phage tail protein [Aliarcobacter butzleri]|uniref:phage tail protein n=1 Tax=Aliarcobacter butzleri TaxID=28197 RepID=UPI001EE0DE2D|nr:tail fiber protein [Aliarcobacter butzleri]MCG3680244.1 tail fiber protein [Aliarcobacter butzleri]
MSDNITKLTPFDASKRALEGTTNFRENANYSWAWIAQHTQEVNKLIDDLNIYKNGLKDILSEYVLENLEENVVNNAISKKINISDIQDVLDSTATDKPLSANQGRVLKGFIDNIILLLSSDDTDLDELQEIINFMKQSKSVLDTLIIEIEANIVPVSTVLPFATTNLPDGFLECNGAAISRTAYSKLFAAIGTTFGAGDGTTFNIPDLRGEFIRGFDNGRGLDTGRTFGSKQADEFESHSHTGTASSAGAHTHAFALYASGAPVTTNTIGAGNINGTSFGNGTTSSTGAHSHSLTINNTGGIETRPTNLALIYGIKY